MCLSTERDGRETFPASVRHDGVEDSPRATLELAAAIVLIEPATRRLNQETSNGVADLPDFFHDCQCDATPPRKLRTLVQKTDGVFDEIAHNASRCVQILAQVSRLHARASCRKFASSSWPCSVRIASGWNWTPASGY